MTGKLIVLLASLTLAASLFAAPQAAAPFTELSQEILTSLQAYWPVTATEMGIHTYDGRLADYSDTAVRKMISQLKRYETRLGRIKTATLSSHDRVNYRLLKSNVDIALQNLDKIEWYKKSPQLYVDEAVNGIYFLMLSQYGTPADRASSVLNRMKAVPGLLAVARLNLSHPPSVYIEAAKESLESALEFYRNAAGELMQKVPDKADGLLAASTQAREALNDFLAYLGGLKPGDDKAFAIGKENFDYKLSHQYFLPYDSDSLLHLGENLLADAQKTYAEQEKYIESNRQNGQDSVFIPATFSRQDILDYYNWEVSQVRTFLEMNEVITIPENIAPVTVIETPPFLRSMIGGIAYQPCGPFDLEQHGYFYVRPLPDSLDREQLDARYRYVHRRGFKGSVVHEAYPGHHLQMQIAGRNVDPIRKWQTNMMMVEGWALYSEEMMYHAGLFGSEDANQWLGILGGIRFRAARIVADVKLHTGSFTYDECVDWMIKTLEVETESDEQYVRKEVRRYTHEPTVQMSYLVGKREITMLRDAMMQKEGSNFSERSFYDRLLAEGSIPPPLMWEILDLKPPTDSTRAGQ